MALTNTVLRAVQAGARLAFQAGARCAARQVASSSARAAPAAEQPSPGQDTARDRRRTRKGASSRTRRATPTPVSPDRAPAAGRPPESAHARSSSTADNRGYLGEETNPVQTSYRPAEDGNADPGEVVWTWVPYDEDRTSGKDRPVLVIARRGRQVLGLMMSLVDPGGDAAQEARHGPHWLTIGTGAWDPQGRDTEVRLDRVMIFDPAGVRREGARLDQERFDVVAQALRRVPG